MGVWHRLFGRGERDALAPLYKAVVAEARRPDWYRQGRVPDTLDGRFDMVAAVLSLVLLRLEEEGDAGRAPSAHLTELFVEDMDGQLRERGIGDIAVLCQDDLALPRACRVSSKDAPRSVRNAPGH